MTAGAANNNERASLEKALRTIKQMRAAMHERDRLDAEPLAIVGMGCRFPGGAHDLQAFWQLLREGRDGIREVPAERWDVQSFYHPEPGTPGKTYTKHGGFIDDAYAFDASFFNVSPPDARAMDPQHRLMLEVSWEALEDAGIAPKTLRGSRTGVFVGITTHEYYDNVDANELGPYSVTGSGVCFAAGRLSYLLGLNGPSLVTDTACSSSLVAVHLACQSLWRRECRTAITGGVALMLSPLSYVSLSGNRMLSPTGRCHTFDASADGYVRGEGCGMIVVKRLSDAIADGDLIRALIRASVANQDGASAGLTVPNGTAQQTLIRDALAQARITPQDVDYIEAHGTGTSLGDPLEVRSLASVLAARSKDQSPVWIGSVKTNIGHLEAAAGIAGLIKVVLALQNEHIPPHLHLKKLNPNIDWSGLPLKVCTLAVPWARRNDKPRMAGVSSFGASGTNAHAILEEAPVRARMVNPTERPQQLLMLSAHSDAALDALADRYREYLACTQETWADICHTAALGRNHFRHRAAIRAENIESARERLERLRTGDESVPGVARGQASESSGKLAFLFTGQGSQWSGMGRSLYESEPRFKTALDRCNAILEPRLGVGLPDLLWGAQGDRLSDTRYTQPAIFALEYALSQCWAAFGVVPDALIGHSIGEYIAAHIAGVFSLEDALTLIDARARLMREHCAPGGMLAIRAGESAIAPYLAPHRESLSLAAVNGPESIVVAGALDALTVLEEVLAHAQIATKRLAVSHAFHSLHMQPMLAAFGEFAKTITYHNPRIRLISTVTGEEAGAALARAEYWVEHVRATVRFSDAVEKLKAHDVATCLELGPDAILSGLVADIDPACLTLASLHQTRGAWDTMLDALAGLYIADHPIDWAQADNPYARMRARLPTYPFQRAHYRLESRGNNARQDDARISREHPLLGSRVYSPSRSLGYQNEIDATEPAYLGDHRANGEVIFPAAGYLEMLLTAASKALQQDGVALKDFVIGAPLVLDANARARLDLSVEHAGDGSTALTIQSLLSSEAGKDAWRLHAQANAEAATDITTDEAVLGVIKARCSTRLAPDTYYERLRQQGYGYGPHFQGLRELWVGEGEAIGEIESPLADSADGYRLHPALLDAALQVAGAASPANDFYLPVGVDRFVYRRAPRGRVTSHARARAAGDGQERRFDLVLYDAQAEPFVHIEGLRVRRVQLTQGLSRDLQNSIYELTWRERSLSARASLGGRWRIWADRGGVADSLAERLRVAGAEVECIHDAAALADSAFLNCPVPLTGAVFLAALDCKDDVDAPLCVRQLTADALVFAQALAARDVNGRVMWVTCQSQSVGGAEPVNAAQASLWGFGGVVDNEHPELSSVRLDLEHRLDADASADLIANELINTEPEPQVAYRNGVRHVCRLSKHSLTTSKPLPIPARPFALRLREYGELSNLELVERPRRAPVAGEIEISVRAAALNFKEALFALGLLPDFSPAHATELPLGFEYAGYVTALGEGVRDVAPGDAVMGIFPGSLGSYVTVPAASIFKVPATLRLEEAAALPTVFMTAYYALVHCAKLKAGERVLIHAGAGGVGQAALQIARGIGAEVHVTASPGKWDFLRSQGVTRVYNSRTLAFAEEVRTATHDIGVDVVLNSLNGEFIAKSFDSLAKNGRFIEIGKIGVWSAEQAARHRSDVEYRNFDWGDVIAARPSLYREVFDAVLRGFAENRYRPLPVQCYAIESAVDAFRQLAQAKHVGKIVLRVPTTSGSTAPVYEFIRPDRQYLITGGLGALGLTVAERFVERGAMHLVLLGRRGPNETAQTACERMRTAGAQVRIANVDVSDREALQALIQDLVKQGPPLGGVVHAAGVLDDGVLTEQDPARFARVLAPKVDGAFHLENLTRAQTLDFFICFSSVSTLFGAAGQANYAAANAYLDALMLQRRQQGRVGLSIAWGAWAGNGMSARLSEQDRRRFQQLGFGELDSRVGLDTMEWLACRTAGYAPVAAIDWSVVRRQLSATPPLFSELLPAPGASSPAVSETSDAGLLQRLRSLSRQQAQSTLGEFVLTQVARVLGLREAALDVKRPLQELGLDSLMTVELRNALVRALGQKLPVSLLFDYPTIERLTQHLESLLLPGVSEPTLPATLREDAGEPIAIIGMACRFPGHSNDPDAFWSLLKRGADGVEEMGDRRWDMQAYYDADPAAPGKLYARWGGVVDDAENFDSEFFGITPHEARTMDPQQRLLIEMSWEALERAGYRPSEVGANQSGGIFIGPGLNEYAGLSLESTTLRELDGYYGTGNAPSILAGRLSYLLGWQGPSMAVDTACSSSLVALHLACQSLRNADCEIALAGGVNLTLSPVTSVALCKAGMLSPRGRCSTFDAAADGYVRAEGCGVVVVKRLSHAQRDGDCVLAVIRGSAVNQDGRSQGLTAPNGPSQEAVIRRALAQAKLEPAAIDYVETHGTGTPLGDPVEIGALARVFEHSHDKARPLLVGSVKSNIGHLESAAGIAGLIKVVLALQHEELPQQLNFSVPSNHIAWDQIPIRVLDRAMTWRRTQGKPRLAGVSSFGFSGTNAHVILEEAPPHPAKTDVVESRPNLLCLSAYSEKALAALTDRYTQFLNHTDESLADICYTANIARTPLRHRLAVRAGSVGEAIAGLTAFKTGIGGVAVTDGVTREPRGKLAFLFSGQGTQWAGMGRTLYETEPRFKTALDRCNECLQPCLGVDLPALLWGAQSEKLNDTRYTQPAVFALEYSLSELWRAFGVIPDIVIGHSIGEYAAACVASVFSLEDGCTLIDARARLMSEHCAAGGMLAVQLSESAIIPYLAPHAGALSLAAVNGPSSVVVSGEFASLDALQVALTRDGIKTTRLNVSHGFHSVQMRPMREMFEKASSAIAFQPPRIPMLSSVTGQGESSGIATPGYWVRHVEACVHFGRAIETLAALGAGVCVEVGPGSTLLGLASEIFADPKLRCLPSLQPGVDGWVTVLQGLAELYVDGYPIDWKGFDKPYARARVPLPTYPFQRRRHWMDKNPGSAKVDLEQWVTQLDNGSLSPQERALLTKLLERIRASGNLGGVPARDAAQIDNATSLYQLAWRKKPLTLPSEARSLVGQWLIFAGNTPRWDAVISALQAQGAQPICVRAAARFAKDKDGNYRINPRERSHFDRIFAAIQQPVRGVIYGWGADAEPAELGDSGERLLQAIEYYHAGALHLLQAMIVANVNAPNWWLTAGAQSVDARDPAPVLATASLGALAKVARLEHPELPLHVVDVGKDVDIESPILELIGELRSSDGEPDVVYRNAERYVARLVRGASSPAPSAASVRPDATYLITGGMGGLGLVFARWLVEQGARRLVLAGRQVRDDTGMRATLRALRAQGAQIDLVACDVCAEAQVTQLIETIDPQHPLAGILHAAGIFDPGALIHQTYERLAPVCGPKVLGAWNLHRATRDRPLDFFLLFSSVSALVGARGTGHYAAANAFLDALARQRRYEGLPALSVAWGPWKEDGVIARHGGRQFAQEGALGLLDTRAALSFVPALVASSESHIGVLSPEWRQLQQDADTGALSPLWGELLTTTSVSPSTVASSLLRLLSALPPAERRSRLHDLVRAEVAKSLGVQSRAVQDDADFSRLGLDSLATVQMRMRILQKTGVLLPVAAMLRNGTVFEIAKLLEQALSTQAPDDAMMSPSRGTPEDQLIVEFEL